MEKEETIMTWCERIYVENHTTPIVVGDVPAGLEIRIDDSHSGPERSVIFDQEDVRRLRLILQRWEKWRRSAV
jgi:hypothetical protein